MYCLLVASKNWQLILRQYNIIHRQFHHFFLHILGKSASCRSVHSTNMTPYILFQIIYIVYVTNHILRAGADQLPPTTRKKSILTIPINSTKVRVNYQLVGTAMYCVLSSVCYQLHAFPLCLRIFYLHSLEIRLVARSGIDHTRLLYSSYLDLRKWYLYFWKETQRA